MMPTALVLLLIACGGDAGTPSPTPTPQVDAHAHEDEGAAGQMVIDVDVLRDLRITTAPITALGGEETTSVLGELDVDEARYAEVGVPVTARVRRLLAGSGDTVREGQPLAELESAELGRARADLAAARARATSASAAADRKVSLAGRAVSAREAEAAVADAAAATAEVRAAEAALSAYGNADSRGGATFTIRAPIGGVVLDRDARVGAVVDAEHTLFRVADLSRLWLIVHAYERDALRAREGDTVEVAFPALPNERYTGTIARVGRAVDATSRTVPIRVVLDNPDGVLRPGMSATARLPVGTPGVDVLAAPAEAVQRVGERWVVFLPVQPGGEGRFEVRPVGRGRDLGGSVELLSGVVAGEVVVVEGAFLLKAEAAKRAGGGDAHEH